MNRLFPARMGSNHGAALTEYIVIGLLIGVFSIGSVSVFGDDIRALFATADNSLAGVDSTPATRPGKAESYNLKGIRQPVGGTDPAALPWGEAQQKALQQALDQANAHPEKLLADWQPMGNPADKMPLSAGWRMEKTGFRDSMAQALEPVTGLPEIYQDKVHSSQDQMSRGLEQIKQGELLRGGGNGLAGMFNYVFSPLSAFTRSVFGRPVENSALYLGADPAWASALGTTAEVGAAWATGMTLEKTAPAMGRAAVAFQEKARQMFASLRTARATTAPAAANAAPLVETATPSASAPAAAVHAYTPPTHAQNLDRVDKLVGVLEERLFRYPYEPLGPGTAWALDDLNALARQYGTPPFMLLRSSGYSGAMHHIDTNAQYLKIGITAQANSAETARLAAQVKAALEAIIQAAQ